MGYFTGPIHDPIHGGPTHHSPTHHSPRNHIPTHLSPRHHIPTDHSREGGGVGIANKALTSRFIFFRAIYTLQPSHNAHVHTHTRTNSHTHTHAHKHTKTHIPPSFLIGVACKKVLANISKKTCKKKGHTLPNPNPRARGGKKKDQGGICVGGDGCLGVAISLCVCVCKRGGGSTLVRQRILHAPWCVWIVVVHL